MNAAPRRRRPATMPTITLPPETASVPAARRWVGGQLADVPEAADRAALLVSELVTNAVLHAGTAVTVTLERHRGAVRVAVADDSPRRPELKHYDVAAGTGRGLHLVASLADRWRVEARPGGKAVVFELAVGDAAPSRSPLDDELASLADRSGLDEWAAEPATACAAGPELFTVELVALPVAVLNRASAEYDALYREFRLVVEREPTSRRSVPGRLLGLIDDLGVRFSGFTEGNDAELAAARARGVGAIDLRYRLPLEAAPFCSRLDLFLDEADAYCRAGTDLLTLAAAPESVAFRKWFLGEFVHQLAGSPPVPWPDSPWARGLSGRSHVGP